MCCPCILGFCVPATLPFCDLCGVGHLEANERLLAKLCFAWLSCHLNLVFKTKESLAFVTEASQGLPGSLWGSSYHFTSSVINQSINQSVLTFSPWRSENRTQGFMHTGQMLYHWAIAPAPDMLCSWFFFMYSYLRTMENKVCCTYREDSRISDELALWTTMH